MKRFGKAISETVKTLLIGGATVGVSTRLEVGSDAIVVIPAALFGFYLAWAAREWIDAMVRA